jgi:hypothetical protein
MPAAAALLQAAMASGAPPQLHRQPQAPGKALLINQLAGLSADDRQSSIAFTIDQIIANGDDLRLVPELLDAAGASPPAAAAQLPLLTTAQAAAAFAASGEASGGSSSSGSGSAGDAPPRAAAAVATAAGAGLGRDQGIGAPAAAPMLLTAVTADPTVFELDTAWLDGVVSDEDGDAVMHKGGDEALECENSAK